MSVVLSRKKNMRIGLVGIAGAVLIIAGLVFGWAVLPVVVEKKIADTVAIRNGTESFDRWKELPITMLFRAYVYEVLNPEEIWKNGETPKVRQRGPFVYKEKRFKKSIVMNEDKDMAEYYQMASYEFDSELSAESDEVEFTMVNVLALGFAYIAEALPGLRPTLILFSEFVHNMWPGDHPVFIKAKVKDYLFGKVNMLCNPETSEDVKEPLKKILWKTLCLAFAYIRPERTVVIDDGAAGLNTFSFFGYKKRPDGPYVVKLGINEPRTIGEIQMWNRKSDLGGMWGGKTCNAIAGTDSTVFRPYLHDVKVLKVFNSDICRSINLTYKGPVEYKGVPARRYVTGPEVFASVMDNPENYCYCPQSVKGLTIRGGCLKTGILDLSSCQGAPVILSLPHFLMLDPVYQGMVPEGMRPNETLHGMYVDLEPNTGYPLRGAVRVQMNVFLKKIAEVRCLKDMPETIVPMLWLDEGVELTDKLIEEVKSRLLTLLKVADIAVWSMIGVGMLLVSVALIVFGVRSAKK